MGRSSRRKLSGERRSACRHPGESGAAELPLIRERYSDRFPLFVDRFRVGRFIFVVAGDKGITATKGT